jgi:hypothetical protein
VQAGISSCARGVVPGVGQWRRAVMRPSGHPSNHFHTLAAALTAEHALPELLKGRKGEFGIGPGESPSTCFPGDSGKEPGYYAMTSWRKHQRFHGGVAEIIAAAGQSGGAGGANGRAVLVDAALPSSCQRHFRGR